jgi:hypothetical protein
MAACDPKHVTYSFGGNYLSHFEEYSAATEDSQ